MVASRNGFVGVVRVLLEGGAEIACQAKDGRTALMLASQFGHEDVVRVLLDWGADIDQQDREGYTALLLAAQHAHPGCVQMLLEKGDGTLAKLRDVDSEWSEMNWQFTTHLQRLKRAKQKDEKEHAASKAHLTVK